MTDVIFKKYPDGDILAVFPGIAGTSNYRADCQSYAHIGQHGSCDISHAAGLKPAKPAEYADLLKELTDLIGYDDLKIVRRFLPIHREQRRAQC